jgi:tRNA dimethylallyltransferase
MAHTLDPDASLIVAGPTAVGKTALGLRLAEQAPGEIIVADSMQVYAGLDVGTGKPAAPERAAVPHHLLDCVDPTKTFSAGEFVRRATSLVEAIRSRRRLPLLVGGTGLYLRAYVRGRLAGAGTDPAVRARLQEEAVRAGAGSLFARLAALDPASAARIPPGDLRRIIRALELHELTGEPPSRLRTGLWDGPQARVSAFVVLCREREELYRLIDERCRRMWAEGLLEETRRLLALGDAGTIRPLEALGYRQAAAYLAGRLGAGAALEEMQRATRNYAKRQLTWFRREPGARWVTVRGWDWVAPVADRILAGDWEALAGR